MANTGQDMAGLHGNTVFHHLSTLVAMALAGRFAAQGRKAPTIGTRPCDTVSFGVLVLGTVVLVAALSFLPALALGPIAEHFGRHASHVHMEGTLDTSQRPL